MRLRIGLHSGPVTAGVLRSQKARFQLFGDTVNTASRMETTGQAGRIHVTQETANLLLADGKGHWLHQREHVVAVKGKGEMVTYWVEPKPSGSNNTMPSGNEKEDGELEDLMKRSVHKLSRNSAEKSSYW